MYFQRYPFRVVDNDGFGIYGEGEDMSLGRGVGEGFAHSVVVVVPGAFVAGEDFFDTGEAGFRNSVSLLCGDVGCF